MPIIPLTIGAVLLALITIAFGIFFEKYYVGRNSMIFNSLNVLILAMTINIPASTLILLIIYAAMGWASTRVTGYSAAKQLFGSKVYGSLSLALALDETDGSAWAKNLLEFLASKVSVFQFFGDKIVVFACLIIGLLVMLGQVIVMRKGIHLRI